MPLPSKPVKESSGALILKGTIALMEELVQIMALEMDLINARKYDEHKELLKKKQRLTMDYRANIKAIAVNPDMLKDVPENLRKAAKAAGQKLADASERNGKYLRTAVVATQRLLQSIISMVKKEVLPDVTYNNPNTAAFELGNYSPTCKPIAVDRTA